MIPEFKSGDFWTHDRFMDVCVQIINVQWAGKSTCKIEVFWWNKTSGFNIGIPQVIVIQKSQYEFWKKIEKPVRSHRPAVAEKV